MYICIYVCIYIYMFFTGHVIYFFTSYIVACFGDSIPIGSLHWSISNLVWFPWWPGHGAMDPFEGTERTSEFTHFNLVVRLSKVKQLALYHVSLRRSLGWTTCRCAWPLFFRSVYSTADVQTSFFPQRCSRDRQLHNNELGNRRMACPLGVVYFGFLVKLNQLRT